MHTHTHTPMHTKKPMYFVKSRVAVQRPFVVHSGGQSVHISRRFSRTNSNIAPCSDKRHTVHRRYVDMWPQSFGLWASLEFFALISTFPLPWKKKKKISHSSSSTYFFLNKLYLSLSFDFTIKCSQTREGNKPIIINMSRILEYLTVSCISDSVEAAIYTCGEIPDMSRRSWVLPTCQSLFLILACYWIIFCCVSARPQDRMSVSTVLSDFQLWTHSRPLHFVAKAEKLLEEGYWIMWPTELASCSCRWPYQIWPYRPGVTNTKT